MGTTHGDVRIGRHPRRCCTRRKGAVRVWQQEASSGFGRRSSALDRDKRDIAGPRWTRRTRHSIRDHWRTDRGSHTHRHTRHNGTSSATTCECASSCAPCAGATLVARRSRTDDASLRHAPLRVMTDSVILRPGMVSRSPHHLSLSDSIDVMGGYGQKKMNGTGERVNSSPIESLDSYHYRCFVAHQYAAIHACASSGVPCPTASLPVQAPPRV